MTTYRQLLQKEIATLTVYGCSAENWKDIQVPEEFSPQYFFNVHFSGKILLGTYNKVFELPGGIKKHSGIYNCQLHNCVVGNDVFIDKINNYIANYKIEEGAYIENVNLLLTDCESTFGNGTKVSVMIEAGGREVPIYDQLSAPLAYMLTFYRNNSVLIESLSKRIADYSYEQRSDIGLIGKNARITNCDTIKNVRIGEFALIKGALLLENGTVISNKKAPVYIGRGVQCRNFIIHSGSIISESALVTNCFIGQACIISKQFSAIDSLFFANSQGLHGEAVSIFAGPFTVTHHKSTLMLTALYSFMNAGSGTNFSNHMYKLGPVHQGITERGVKTSSDAYIMWPAHIGAYTAVLGRHKGNPDIANFPFSYLIENDGESNLLIGINLHSAGTIRDIQKWPKRDGRTDENKLDAINFDFLSPYTLSKALKGIEIMKELLEKMDPSTNFVWYQNCKIKRSTLRKGIDLYQMAIDQFIGKTIVDKIEKKNSNSKEEILETLKNRHKISDNEWVDMSGLLCPKEEIEKLISEITSNSISLDKIQLQLIELHKNTPEHSWSWALNILQLRLEKSLNDVSIEDIILIIEKWKNATLTFNDIVLRDAKKEFNSISKTGFGLDGNENDKQLDFNATRGTFEGNEFVKDIIFQTEGTKAIADRLIESLKGF